MRHHLSVAMAINRLTPKGGLEDNCLRVAAELASRGHRIVIFTAEPASVPGIETRLLKGPDAAKTNHGRMLKLAQTCRREFKKAEFDRTIAFQMMPGPDYVFLADPIRQADGLDIWKRLTTRYRVYKSIEADTFAPASKTRIIGLSQAQMDPFVRSYRLSPDRYRIAPPTLNPGKIRPEVRTVQTRQKVRADLGLAPATPVLLSLALHGWVKGLDRTVDALDGMKDAVLLVAGIEPDSKAAATTLANAKSPDVRERIRFLGFLEPDRLLDVMAAAHVLAHPARREVTGAVILEAIVNGLPVVATDICGFAGHIEEANAGEILNGPFAPEAYRSALQRVIGNSAALSQNGIAYGRNPWLCSGISQVCDWIENGF